MIIFWVCNFLGSCVSLCVCARGSVLLHPPMWTKMGLCHLLVCCSAWVHLYMHFKIRRDDKHTYTYTHLNFPSMHLNGSIHIQMRPNIRLSFPVCIYCCICITRANIYIKTCTNGRYHPVKVWLTMNCIHVFWGNFGWYLNLLLRMDIYIYTPTSETFLCKVSKISRM